MTIKRIFINKAKQILSKYTRIKMEQQLSLSTLDESLIHIRHIMKQYNNICIRIVDTLPDSIRKYWVFCAVLENDFDQLIQLCLCSQQNNIDAFQIYRQQTNKRHQLKQGVLSRIFTKFRNLRSLNISNFSIGQSDVKILKQNGGNLQSILLGGNDMTANEIRVLARGDFQKIQNIYLVQNKIGNMGLEYLAKANLPNLQILYVYDCGVTIDGFKLFAKANWPVISKIQVYNPKIGQISKVASFSVKNFSKRFGPLDQEFRKFANYQTWIKDINTLQQLSTNKQDQLQDNILLAPYKV